MCVIKMCVKGVKLLSYSGVTKHILGEHRVGIDYNRMLIAKTTVQQRYKIFRDVTVGRVFRVVALFVVS